MSPVNKFEAIGIFLSVAIMAIALTLLRFETAVFSDSSIESDTQTANVSASVEAVATDVDTSLEQDLRDTINLEGELTALVTDDVRIGSGDEAVSGDSVTVHYIGTLRDGTQFDNSNVRGEPFTFTLGEGKVIAGWEQGILGMKVGGQRILVIPPELAYGNRQVGPIPPLSTLIFSVELLSIQ